MNCQVKFGVWEHATRVATAAGCIYNPSVDKIISITKGEKLLGGVIYQGYTKNSVETHIAGFAPNWMTRDFLWVIFDYPFIQLQCRVIFAQIPERNHKSIDFVTKLGFENFISIPDVYPDCGVAVMRLYKNDCRWLNIRCFARDVITAERDERGQEI